MKAPAAARRRLYPAHHSISAGFCHPSPHAPPTMACTHDASSELSTERRCPIYSCVCMQVQQQRMQKIVARQGPTVSTPPTAVKGALKSTSSKVVGMAGWGSACQSAMQKKRLPTACSNSKSAHAAMARVWPASSYSHRTVDAIPLRVQLGMAPCADKNVMWRGAQRTRFATSSRRD